MDNHKNEASQSAPRVKKTTVQTNLRFTLILKWILKTLYSFIFKLKRKREKQNQKGERKNLKNKILFCLEIKGKEQDRKVEEKKRERNSNGGRSNVITGDCGKTDQRSLLNMSFSFLLFFFSCFSQSFFLNFATFYFFFIQDWKFFVRIFQKNFLANSTCSFGTRECCENFITAGESKTKFKVQIFLQVSGIIESVSGLLFRLPIRVGITNKAKEW